MTSLESLRNKTRKNLLSISIDLPDDSNDKKTCQKAPANATESSHILCPQKQLRSQQSDWVMDESAGIWGDLHSALALSFVAFVKIYVLWFYWRWKRVHQRRRLSLVFYVSLSLGLTVCFNILRGSSHHRLRSNVALKEEGLLRKEV